MEITVMLLSDCLGVGRSFRCAHHANATSYSRCRWWSRGQRSSPVDLSRLRSMMASSGLTRSGHVCYCMSAAAWKTAMLHGRHCWRARSPSACPGSAEMSNNAACFLVRKLPQGATKKHYITYKTMGLIFCHCLLQCCGAHSRLQP